MWPFRQRQLLDEDTAAWHLDNFIWLMEEFGRDGDFAATELVLPRPGFFPTEGKTGHALAEHLFEKVREYCVMDTWKVTLVADENPLAMAGGEVEAVAVAAQPHAAGTFSVTEGGVVITYTPDLLKRPTNLIATFAHELAHYLLLTAQTEPICEADEREFLTDLTAAFMGFGVFLANARFEHVSNAGATGWRRSGYLPETDLVFATAIFIAVQEMEPDGARASLDAHLRGQLDRALKQLEGRPEIDTLRRLATS